ncbi:MAG: type II toxin-antitoxin system RelE/ParE family toxin [Nitrospinae bacterium]|nr:type II toxin-antitoxin system RelE/ParE family toxin [Nitrospinota bacterium]
MKPAIWLGDSRKVVKAFPDDARHRAGAELFRVQKGGEPSNFKPMAGIGPGVYEIRIVMKTHYRVIYLASRPEGIYVLHAFKKDSARGIKTPHREILTARERLRNIGK